MALSRVLKKEAEKGKDGRNKRIMVPIMIVGIASIWREVRMSGGMR